MSTTRVVRYTVEDPTDPTISPTFTQTDSGTTWNLVGSVYRARITNPSTQTKTATWSFTEDFRKQDPIYGISSNRCIVRFRARISTAGSGLFPLAGEQYTGSGSLAKARYLNTYTGDFGSPSFGFNDYYQTGSDVLTTTSNLQQINNLQLIFRTTNVTTENPTGQFVLDIDIDDPRIRGNTGLSGSLFFSFEANNHTIDGLEGDISPVINCSSLITANSTRLRVAQATLITTTTVTENSVSVITGVEKTLQNNITLSAAASIKLAASSLLLQETELFGTTFNFRFMDALIINTQSTLAASINKKTNLASPLTLSTSFTSILDSNMIFDIAKDYTWDDFNVVGYFITGYSAAGYAADSSDYGWDELGTDEWDAWTYEVWGGIEIGWELWPDDVWNSTRTLLHRFTLTEAAKIIASGVAQLLSRTTLTDNSAFRIEGVPAEIRSDFVVDASPSGLIGGSGTMISDAVLTALANYIINNSHTISGAFTPTLLANYIARFLWQAQSEFNIIISPTFKPSGITNAQCIAVVDALANAKYGPTKTLQGAFDPTIIVRMFIGTDPFNIHKLLQETRRIFIEAESRGIEIAEEIRLNSIPLETKAFLVPEETRKMKLKIPPMTNRFTTPKVRSDI
jgi:hypothetical protein